MAEFNLPRDATPPRFTLTDSQKQMGIEIVSDNTHFNRKPVDERVAIALEQISESLKKLQADGLFLRGTR